MSEDPAAILFLGGMIASDDAPGLDNSIDDVTNLNGISISDPNNNKNGEIGEKRAHRNVRVKKIIRKVVQDTGYKWPYYDSYAPGLGMNKEDKRIVRRGVI